MNREGHMELRDVYGPEELDEAVEATVDLVRIAYRAGGIVSVSPIRKRTPDGYFFTAGMVVDYTTSSPSSRLDLPPQPEADANGATAASAPEGEEEPSEVAA